MPVILYLQDRFFPFFSYFATTLLKQQTWKDLHNFPAKIWKMENLGSFIQVQSDTTQ